MGDGRSDDAADLHYDRHSENGERAGPDDPAASLGAWNSRCWARAIIGELETALQDCNQALQMRPAYSEALDSRGLVYLKMGKLDEAIADYTSVLEVRKKNVGSPSRFGRNG
jgi:tetratricopeptide (TPR) repeat protein